MSNNTDFIKPIDRDNLFTCNVAGLAYRDYEDFQDDLYEGMPLALVREPNNPYDRNAIAIAFTCDYNGHTEDFDFDNVIGYIPRRLNQQLATLLDMGWQDIFECEITKIDNELPLNERLEITIYVNNKLKDDDHNLRATLLNQESYEDFVTQLTEKGFATFRWGGFPLWAVNLPDTNENVLFVYPKGKKAILYLTRVVASGDQCTFFLEDPTEYEDDRTNYVLTNIKGPSIISEEQFNVFKEQLDEGSQPEKRLDTKATHYVYQLLNQLG